MKCVQDLSGVVKRVSEDRAVELAQAGWAFVPKMVWKNSDKSGWTKNATPPNPMSESKKRRIEMKSRTAK